MNINGLQWFLIAASVLSAISGASANLSDLFGTGLAHTIVSAASFLNMILTAVMTPLVGNANMVKTVAALPGVDRVSVNTQASPALAAVATDPQQPKVGGSTASDQQKLQDIAKG